MQISCLKISIELFTPMLRAPAPLANPPPPWPIPALLDKERGVSESIARWPPKTPLRIK